MNLAKKTKRPYLILCEGPMDAIACHQFGFDCAVASQGTALTEDQVNMISKYTDQVIMTYDNDAAGQNATQRAIAMFDKAGVKVRILRLQGAKDADEFLHKYGADRFDVLLQGSEGQADYRLDSLKAGFDLSVDADRVEFSRKAAELISTFPNAVEREIYADKAAQLAGVSKDVLLGEIARAYKKRLNREKRQQEQRELTPASTLQQKTRGIHYDNVRSARAEEIILAQILMEPGLIEEAAGLEAEDFTVPMFARAYGQLKARYRQGLGVSLAVLEDFTPEELSHLTEVCQREGKLLSEQGFADCVRLVKEQPRSDDTPETEEDLLTLQSKYRDSKGYGG